MKISVIMGMYNCETTLEQAVRAIQNQTYDNWELILCDDGSTDKTYTLALKLSEKDKRIVLLKNEYNKGLNETLNYCLKYATGEFIARMDADDDCVSYRFQKQIEFLNSNSEFDIVSSWMALFDANGIWGYQKTPERPTAKDVICGSPICHAPVMIRKKCMDEVGGYTVDKKMMRVEDVNLWIKLYANGYRCYNIQEPLYRMRNDQDALNRRKYKYRMNSTYVRLKGCKLLKMDAKCYLRAFSPMIIGLIPAKIRYMIKRKSKYL